MTAMTMDLLRKGRFARTTAGFTAAVFSFVFYLSPTGDAIAQEADPVPGIELTGTPEQKMSQGLVKVQQLAAHAAASTSQRLENESGLLDDFLDLFGLSVLTLEDTDDLQTLSRLLEEQNTQALERFSALEADLVQRGLPAEVLERHNSVVAQYQAKYYDMRQRLQALLDAETLQEQQEAAESLDEMMQGEKLERSHQLTDPNNLPFGTPDASATREPATTPLELSRLTGISPLPQGMQVAANIITPEMLNQPGGPTDGDLAETPDITFSDAIRAKVLELEDDPVKIYNWVRNNIEFIPSYGSIRGAEYTMQQGKGNAFDTASLLIALLRAANIPARYAYGTVEIPAEQVMNWVGGVDVPAAAQQLLGQGGIPNTGLIEGGEITIIRLEHVWVEAWVDYFPSRAAKHEIGDQWIPLDASFKQYVYEQGLDFSSVSFDADGLLDGVLATADIQENSVANLPTDFITAEFAALIANVEGFISSTGSDPTVAEVLGSKTLIPDSNSSFAAGLPYQVIQRTNNFSQLPDSLRHKVRFTLQGSSGSGFGFTSFYDIFTHEVDLPALAGSTMSLSFTPANDAANEVLLSFLPDQELSASNVPTNLPGYLLDLRAELSIDGQPVADGGAISMGTETNNRMEIFTPGAGWSSTDASGVAGEYRAIGVDVGGYSVAQLEGLQQENQALAAFFEVGQVDESFDKHQLAGRLTQSNILSYFAMNEYLDSIESRQFGVVDYRLPSYGYFLTALVPSYYFGIPVGVDTTGVTMDVPYLRSMSYAADNSKTTWLDYNRAKGLRASYLENAVPELLLSTPGDQLEGVSAVKILSLAMQQGQRIYQLNRGDSALLSNIQIDSGARQDIINSLNAGKTVTVHESPVNVQGWVGSGYLVIDPETGAGGYLISGGANGGSIADSLLGFVGWLLGMVDGAYGHLSVENFGRAIFSDRIKSIQRALRWSGVLGFIALGISLFNVFSDGFSWNAVGAAAVAVLAFALTVLAVSAIAAASGIVLGAILGGLAAFVINNLATRLTRLLF